MHEVRWIMGLLATRLEGVASSSRRSTFFDSTPGRIEFLFPFSYSGVHFDFGLFVEHALW